MTGGCFTIWSKVPTEARFLQKLGDRGALSLDADTAKGWLSGP